MKKNKLYSRIKTGAAATYRAQGRIFLFKYDFLSFI